MYLSFLRSKAMKKVLSAKMRDHKAVLGWLQILNPRGREGVVMTSSGISVTPLSSDIRSVALVLLPRLLL